MKLFNVGTTAKQYGGCKGVAFCWFRTEGPSEPRPYGELIENYEPGNVYAEGAIDEMFTEDEALLLKEYLDRTYTGAGVTVIEEQPLPIPNNTMGCGAIPVGDGNDFHMLDRNPEYSLPFKVWGYFDLRGCTLIDNGDTYRHRLMTVRRNPDGTIDAHMKTNPEATARERLIRNGP
jgi:hypothetical protein